jgi:transposase
MDNLLEPRVAIPARQPTHSPSYHEPPPLPSWSQLVVARSSTARPYFCALQPDHSAFSHARNERFPDSGIFRIAFERVVGACIGAGLVGGEGFAVDASLIVADANKQRSIPGPRWNKELDA